MIALGPEWGQADAQLPEYGHKSCDDAPEIKKRENELSKSWRTSGYPRNELCETEEEWKIFSRKISSLISPPTELADYSSEDRLHDETKVRFEVIARQWKLETGGMSSVSQITSNKHYLRILAMGQRVIPYIIDDLRKEAAPWFYALSVLAERDDIGREYRGQFRKIANAWIEWWENEGHLVCQ